MRVCVIDGQGGGLGRLLVSRLRGALGERHAVVALGITPAAARAMREAGASCVSVGQSAIVGMLNLVLPGAMAAKSRRPSPF